MIKEFILKTVTEHQVNAVDVSAGGAGILAWLKWAPDVAAFFTVLWLGLRIFIAFRDEVFKKREK
jgi:hypothetical protein